MQTKTVRKAMKKRARQVIRRHYVLLLAVCLVAVFLGNEFAGSLAFASLPTPQGIQTQVKNYIGSVELENSGFWNSVSAVLSIVAGDSDETAGSSETSAGEAPEHAVLGRRRGVLAKVVNGLTGGLFLLQVTNALCRLGLSKNVVVGIVVFLLLLLILAYWFLIKNMYAAVSRRMFLECRTYEKVAPQRFLFFLRARRWLNVCRNMLMLYIFRFLWSLTIVGGIIKHYSYFLVPYITAENPEIGWPGWITLSRRMMNGHKWECFVLELTYLGWWLLGIVTLGLTDTLYTNAYRTAFFTEYYAGLRQCALENGLEGSGRLCDRYLFEKADPTLLQQEYRDIIRLKEKAPLPQPQTGRVLAFIEQNFGVTLRNRADEEKFRACKERELLIAAAEDAVEGRSYPDRLSPSPIHRKNSRLIRLHYLRRYSVTSLILLFFIFSFIGWAWEVGLHLLNDGRFVNRGTMHGPWLPIYGFGGVLILLFLYRLRRRPALEFGATVLLCGIVEYFTSFFLEKAFNGMRWWDYSGYYLNLNGRICAEGLFVFGVGGMAIVYLLAPVLDNRLRRLKPAVAIPLCAVLLAVFVGDQVYSSHHPNAGAGITDYERSAAAETHQ